MTNSAILNETVSPSCVAIPLEHERRFCLNFLDVPFGFTKYPPTSIIQGYLEDRFRTRIRDECSDNQHVYTRTRKTGEGISRSENECVITIEEFDDLWKNIKCYLMKNRYFIPWGNTVIQLNTFHNELAGYMQIEVEFNSYIEAIAFDPPKWFGQEVTDDERHNNYSLAKFGLRK